MPQCGEWNNWCQKECGPWNNWCLAQCGAWNDWCRNVCGPWNGWCSQQAYGPGTGWAPGWGGPGWGGPGDYYRRGPDYDQGGAVVTTVVTAMVAIGTRIMTTTTIMTTTRGRPTVPRRWDTP